MCDNGKFNIRNRSFQVSGTEFFNNREIGGRSAIKKENPVIILCKEEIIYITLNCMDFHLLPL